MIEIVLGLPRGGLQAHPNLHLGKAIQLFLGVDGFRLLMGGPPAVALLSVDHLAAKRRCQAERVFPCAVTAGMRKWTEEDDRESCSKTSPWAEATSFWRRAWDRMRFFIACGELLIDSAT